MGLYQSEGGGFLYTATSRLLCNIRPPPSVPLSYPHLIAPFRRFCRRYWFLGGTCDLLYVEEPDGTGIGLVGSVGELDAIMERLNRRGGRYEGGGRRVQGGGQV